MKFHFSGFPKNFKNPPFNSPKANTELLKGTFKDIYPLSLISKMAKPIFFSSPIKVYSIVLPHRFLKEPSN